MRPAGWNLQLLRFKGDSSIAAPVRDLQVSMFRILRMTAYPPRDRPARQHPRAALARPADEGHIAARRQHRRDPATQLRQR